MHWPGLAGAVVEMLHSLRTSYDVMRLAEIVRSFSVKISCGEVKLCHGVARVPSAISHSSSAVPSTRCSSEKRGSQTSQGQTERSGPGLGDQFEPGESVVGLGGSIPCRERQRVLACLGGALSVLAEGLLRFKGLGADQR